MRCGIDLDGVVYQWEATARMMLKDRFGVVISESESWDWIEDRTTPEQWEWLWTSAVNGGVFAKGEPYPGAIEALRDLQDRGDHLVILTHRPRAAWADTLWWLDCFGIEPVEVHLFGNGGDKGVVPCDWYVEDRTDNALVLTDAGKPVYLMNRPWNRGAIPHRLRRVFGWEDLRGHIGL